MMQATHNKLVITLPSDTEVRGVREFEAPRELVFRAFTEPELISRWWGPHKYEVIVDKFDARPGGAWRIINRGADGFEHAFRGVFKEVVAPERITWTFEYEPFPGHISVETASFEDLGSRTRVTTLSTFDSQAERDAMVQSGMESGAIETYERLDMVLAGLLG